MPKTNPKQKGARKTTQLDPLKSIRAQIRSMDAKLNVCMNRTEFIIGRCDSLYSKIGEIHTLNDSAISDAYERGKASVLPAQEQETAKWVPTEGDYIKAKQGSGCIYRVERINGPDDWALWHDGTLWPRNTNVAQYCPATPSEIAAHKEAEEERKRKEEEAAELAKPIEFGTRVKYQDDRGWRICIDKPCGSAGWLANKAGTDRLQWMKRHEFTIIK